MKCTADPRESASANYGNLEAEQGDEAYADVGALVQCSIGLGFNLNRIWRGFGASAA